MRAPRVLYVEDESELRVMIADVLDEFGFEVVTAPTAEEGWARLLRRDVDLLLTDYRLPARHADWLVAQARTHGVLTDERMILLSSERSPTGVEGLRFLAKPVDLDDLVGALRAALGDGFAPPPEPQALRLILYVCPGSLPSGHALTRLKQILARYPDGTVRLQVVDVTQAPREVLAADCVALTPLLVSRGAGKPVRLLGDLSQEHLLCDLLHAAGLDPVASP